MPVSSHRSLPISLMILSLIFCLPKSLHAEATDAEQNRRTIAMGLAREGRCEVALPLLETAQSASPTDAEIAQLIGECAIRLQRFDLATKALDAARRLDPETPKVDLHLAIAHFHQGNPDRAAQALARAKATDGAQPEFLLYAGLVALSRADYAEAIQHFESASKVRDRPVEPMASFYLGRAFRQDRQRNHAEAAFEQVIRDHPGTTWADEAKRAIEAIHEDSEIKLWTALEIGFEHDDNALLRGRGAGRPADISNQSDQRGFWFVDVGALLLRTEDWNGGVALRYGGSEHQDLHGFDTHAAGGSLWLDRTLDIADTTLRLQADFDSTWVGQDPFVLSNRWSAMLYKPWGSGGYTMASFALGIDDYRYRTVDVDDVEMDGGCPVATTLCGPAGLNERNARDRDGTGVTATLLHREPVVTDLDWFSNAWIEGEYQYGRYKSDGSEYDHQRHQVELGIGTELPFEFKLTVSGRYAYVPYRNASTFPDQSDLLVPPAMLDQEYFLDDSPRREHETGVRVRLERAFGEHVVVSTRWTRTRNRSTADVFDYTRDLFGISVRIGLGD